MAHLSKELALKVGSLVTVQVVRDTKSGEELFCKDLGDCCCLLVWHCIDFHVLSETVSHYKCKSVAQLSRLWEGTHHVHLNVLQGYSYPEVFHVGPLLLAV